MARFREPSETEEQMWKGWVASRPPHVEAVASRFEPFSLYRMKSSGQRVVVIGFTEHHEGHVSLIVQIAGEFNSQPGEKAVAELDPEDLEPCEVPDPSECAGGGIFNDSPFSA